MKLSLRMRGDSPWAWHETIWEERLVQSSVLCLWQMLVGEAMIFEPQHRCGDTAWDKCGWCCAFQCSWAKRQTTLIWITLPWPHCSKHTSVPGNKRTLDTKHAGPNEETCLTQSWVCLLPRFVETTVVPLGGLTETGKPCSEDNLSGTIWSRFRLFSLYFWFPLIFMKRVRVRVFCSAEMQRRGLMGLIYFSKWIIEQHLLQKGQLVQNPPPVVNYIIYTYTITDHFQSLVPIWMLQQSHSPPSIITVDIGNLI